MINKPHIVIWQDTRRQRKDNKFPVKIKITHKRQRFYYPTNIALTELEFQQAVSPKPGNKLKAIHLKLYELERQATDSVNKIADELHADFTIGLFERQLGIDSTSKNDVFQAFSGKIEQLCIKQQIKTAEGYRSALRALKIFTGADSLAFPEVDKNFLERFEASLLRQKIGLTSIGIYCRYLRSIYNDAIENKVVNYELYPFGKNKYQIPQPSNNKRALEQEDLVKILKYKPEENSWQDYARDMWLFSLLCQGMNLKDIANLRYENISKDKIVFVREKTKMSKRADQTSIVVYLTPEALAIIRKRGNENSSTKQFVFPMFSDDNSPVRNQRIIEQCIKMINKYMREIAAHLKIKSDITFYAARHSFATTLKRQGRSVEEIQEFLGHSNIKTTERYLASFGDDHKREIMQNFVRKLKKTA